MSVFYLLRRFVAGAIVLFLVITLTFFFLRFLPGGPFDRDRVLPEKIRANVEAKYGLDRPVVEQYFKYLKDMIRGDLGPSFKYLGRSVNDVLGDAFPVSIRLGLAALIIAILIGVPAGMISASHPGTWMDTLALVVAAAGFSIPNFVLGALLVYLFSIQVHWLPPALWEGLRYMVLPAFTLGLGPAALIARLTRNAMLETLSEDYIRTALAKGVTQRMVLLKHAFKNALPPVVTAFGLIIAYLITGSFVIEKIFAIPGMGKFFITSVFNRDYPLVMGATILYTTLVLLSSLLVDISYRWLDPRVRLE